MAVYKVPQDVEAEDKLIGPFSFRQFIYLIVMAIAAALAWFLSQIFIGLILIPLPFVIIFGALALPLRREQPMEIYLAAIVKFFLKPRLRLWTPEGNVSLVTITAPKVVERALTKDFTGAEASQRLSYLAQVIDTQGWASRGVMSAPSSASLNDTVAAEAMGAEDVLDADVGIGHNFNSLIEEQDEIRKRLVTEKFQSAIHNGSVQSDSQQTSQSAPAGPVASTDDSTDDNLPTNVRFNPYPTSMRQRVINPSGYQTSSSNSTQAENTSAETSAKTPSPDIIRLANNNDLSISAIAREAHRLEDKAGNEVVISLR